MDGFAEGVPVDLAEEWSLDIGLDVLKVLLAVLLVDFGDVLNGFGGIGGPFGDFGVSDDIGLDEQHGQILFELLIVLRNVGVIGDTLAIDGCVQTTTIVGELIFDHTQLQ